MISGSAKPCKIWHGARNPDGYGVRAVKVDGRWRARGVHRLACIEAHGPPPEDKPEAMHSCDNRACYEPEHLSWGNRFDNMGDAARKNRMPKGARHSRTRFKNEAILAIRASDETLSTLAKRYGVSDAQISRIRLRQQWRHI